jgi:pimeloyl-ACP methyl ester carboxylesterase
MRTVDTSVGRVAVRVAGSGPPVVLLHSNPGDSRDYAAVQPVLARSFTVYAPDWPGYGDSPALRPPAATTALGYADLLPEMLDGLGLDRVALIGNSVGGFAAARLAITAPHRVTALVLVNSGGFNRRDAFVRAFVRVKGTETVTSALGRLLPRLYLRRRTPAVREILARDDARRRAARRGGNDAIAVEAAIWRSFADPRHDLRHAGGLITAPTMLVWGTRDPIVGAAGRAARRALPDAVWHPFRTGHEPYAEAPDEFLAAVLPFLVRHAARSNAQNG